jgi:CheY-like chemotaxis protein
MDAARILVIDGDAWIQRTVGTLLVARGHVVERAVDGEEARARVARVVPDLVIVARLLPDGSGEMLIDSLRRGGRLANVPALVLVGAEDTQNDFAPPPAADLDEHLPKPFRL